MKSRRLLQLLVSAGIIAYLFWRVELSSTLAVLRRVHLSWVGLGAALYLAGQALSAYRWQALARAVGFSNSFGQLLGFYLVGMFFNMLAPAPLGGDLARGLYLAEGDHRRGAALNSVLFDRMAGLVVLVVIGTGALALLPTYGLPPALEVTMGLVAVGLLGGWWVAPFIVRWFFSPRHRLYRLVTGELRPFWEDRSLLAWVSLMSLILQLANITATYLLVRALDLPVALSYCFIFQPAVSIIGSVPVSFGGLGIREGGYVYFLTRVPGVDPAAALSFGLLWLSVLLSGSLVGAAVFVGRGARLPRLSRRRGATRSGDPEAARPSKSEPG